MTMKTLAAVHSTPINWDEVPALNWTAPIHLETYLRLWPDTSTPLSEARQIALDTLAHHRLARTVRHGQTQATPLEQHWYLSLAHRNPDYGVYHDIRYVGELWACWLLYARRYLREIAKCRALFHDVGVIGDLGSGLGYSTAALAQIFPHAHVYGTNLPGPQAAAARAIGQDPLARFTLETEIPGPTNLIFASEYFEHFARPYHHLWEVLQRADFPKYLIIASTFGTRSVGHFDVYYDEHGKLLPGKITGRGFNNRLRRVGYKKVETGFWNNRPAVWQRVGGKPQEEVRHE